MAENIETVPTLPDNPTTEVLDPVAAAPNPEPTPKPTPESPESSAPEPQPEPAAAQAPGNFDAGLQRLQREQADFKANIQGQLQNITSLVSQAIANRPATPTEQQAQAATVNAAEQKATDLVANLDRQIAAAAPDSEAALILKGLRDLAVLTAEQTKTAREEVAKVRAEATEQVQQVARVAQQSAVWVQFDQENPHLAGKGPDEWKKILDEARADKLTTVNKHGVLVPVDDVAQAILSDRFLQRAKASRPKPGVPPLRPRPVGSAPSAPRQTGARIPTEETDEEYERRMRDLRDSSARKWEDAVGRYVKEGGTTST